MKAFEFTKKENMKAMSSTQQRFTAKMIVKEVEKIAKEHNISEEEAYWDILMDCMTQIVR